MGGNGEIIPTWEFLFSYLWYVSLSFGWLISSAILANKKLSNSIYQYSSVDFPLFKQRNSFFYEQIKVWERKDKKEIKSNN